MTTTTPTTAKPVNYTDEQTATVVNSYTEGISIEAIAEAMHKTTRSIIAKLSREGVYQKKAYVSKSGAPAAKKDATADAIGAVLKLTEAQTESLTKCNKTALLAIWAALAGSRPITPEDDEVSGD